MPEFPAVRIFFSFIGLLVIVLAVLTQKLQHALGVRSRREVFTHPSFRRSASIIERLGQLLGVVIGAGFLLQGVGPLILPSAATYTISMILIGFAGAIVLAMFGVVLAHWKSR